MLAVLLFYSNVKRGFSTIRISLVVCLAERLTCSFILRSRLIFPKGTF